MRYDKKVYFISQGKPTRVEHGNYVTEEIRTKQYAHVSDMAMEMKISLYDTLAVSAKTVRIPNHFLDPFDTIEIDGEKYALSLVRKLRRDQVFQVRRA